MPVRIATKSHAMHMHPTIMVFSLNAAVSKILRYNNRTDILTRVMVNEYVALVDMTSYGLV